MIKAIKTKYNGNLFLSRTEARWAVFFKSLNIRYEYEKEGYDLGALGWYLPDFWLPKQQLWVEVKGSDPTLEEIDKLAVVCLGTGADGIILSGIPHYEEDNVTALIEYRSDGKICFKRTLVNEKGAVQLVVPGISLKARFALSESLNHLWIVGSGFMYPLGQRGEKIPLAPRIRRDCIELQRAYVSARSARFEHGEKGGTL